MAIGLELLVKKMENQVPSTSEKLKRVSKISALCNEISSEHQRINQGRNSNLSNILDGIKEELQERDEDESFTSTHSRSSMNHSDLNKTFLADHHFQDFHKQKTPFKDSRYHKTLSINRRLST